MLTTTLSSQYGIGVELFGNGDFGHSGSNEGFRSLMTINSTGFGIIILTNSDKGSDLITAIVNLLSKKYSQ